MPQQRISYVDPAEITDPKMLAELDRCRREGTPRPESHSDPRPCPRDILVLCRHLGHGVPLGRARPQHQGAVPGLRVALGAMRILRQSAVDEIRPAGTDRGRLSRPDQFRDVHALRERQKAALAYTEAITWDLPADDTLWARLHAHFSEPELVELGYFVAITMGNSAGCAP
jgi:hypothetical protein